MADNRIVVVMKDMIEAGYTPASVGQAVAVLERNGSIREASAVLVFAPVPAVFNAQLLLAEAIRVATAARVEAHR